MSCNDHLGVHPLCIVYEYRESLVIEVINIDTWKIMS